MIGLRNAPSWPAVFMAPVTSPACGPAMSRQVPQAAPSRKLSAAPARAIRSAASQGVVDRRAGDQRSSRDQQRRAADPAPADPQAQRPDRTIGRQAARQVGHGAQDQRQARQQPQQADENPRAFSR